MFAYDSIDFALALVSIILPQFVGFVNRKIKYFFATVILHISLEKDIK